MKILVSLIVQEANNCKIKKDNVFDYYILSFLFKNLLLNQIERKFKFFYSFSELSLYSFNLIGSPFSSNSNCNCFFLSSPLRASNDSLSFS